jgi:hypothetical protein
MTVDGKEPAENKGFGGANPLEIVYLLADARK